MLRVNLLCRLLVVYTCVVLCCAEAAKGAQASYERKLARLRDEQEALSRAHSEVGRMKSHGCCSNASKACLLLCVPSCV